MEYISLYVAGLKQYVTFSGRTNRKEYWGFFLISFVIGILCSGIDMALKLQHFFNGGGLLFTLYTTLVLLPTLAISWRRLHDINRSGWWTAILVIPIIGPLGMIYFWVQPSYSGRNQFDEPKEVRLKNKQVNYTRRK